MDGKVRPTISGPLAGYIRELVHTGLYGSTPSEVVRTFVREGLLQAASAGLLSCDQWTRSNMPRRPAIITQADVARAIRAAKQAGAGEVQIKPDGTIIITICAAVSDTFPIMDTIDESPGTSASRRVAELVCDPPMVAQIS